jgi:hypothetical protein
LRIENKEAKRKNLRVRTHLRTTFHRAGFRKNRPFFRQPIYFGGTFSDFHPNALSDKHIFLSKSGCKRQNPVAMSNEALNLEKLH